MRLARRGRQEDPPTYPSARVQSSVYVYSEDLQPLEFYLASRGTRANGDANWLFNENTTSITSLAHTSLGPQIILGCIMS